MKNEQIYSTLYDCCRWNLSEEIKETLEKVGEEFDITQDKGQLFRIAISHGFTDVLKILLEYYDKNKLYINSDQFQGSGYNLEYAKYLNEKNKLHKILEKAYDSAFTISSEIEAILNKYGIPNPKSDSDLEENDLSDSDIVSHEVSKSDESNDVILSPESSNLLGTEPEINFDNLSQP